MTATETTEETLRWRAKHGDDNAAAFIAEVDALHAGRPVTDKDFVLVSRNAWDGMEREAAIGRSVPWAVLWAVAQAEKLSLPQYCPAIYERALLQNCIKASIDWLDANAPKEPQP